MLALPATVAFRYVPPASLFRLRFEIVGDCALCGILLGLADFGICHPCEMREDVASMEDCYRGWIHGCDECGTSLDEWEDRICWRCRDVHNDLYYGADVDHDPEE